MHRIAAALLSGALVLTPTIALADDAGSSLEKLVVEMAQTPEQHAALATYYRSMAKDARAEAKRHDEMARSYVAGKITQRARMNDHCKNIAKKQRSNARPPRLSSADWNRRAGRLRYAANQPASHANRDGLRSRRSEASRISSEMVGTVSGAEEVSRALVDGRRTGSRPIHDHRTDRIDVEGMDPVMAARMNRGYQTLDQFR